MILIAVASSKFIAGVIVEAVIVVGILFFVGRRVCGASDGRDEDEDIHNFS